MLGQGKGESYLILTMLLNSVCSCKHEFPKKMRLREQKIMDVKRGVCHKKAWSAKCCQAYTLSIIRRIIYVTTSSSTHRSCCWIERNSICHIQFPTINFQMGNRRGVMKWRKD